MADLQSSSVLLRRGKIKLTASDNHRWRHLLHTLTGRYEVYLHDVNFACVCRMSRLQETKSRRINCICHRFFSPVLGLVHKNLVMLCDIASLTQPTYTSRMFKPLDAFELQNSCKYRISFGGTKRLHLVIRSSRISWATISHRGTILLKYFETKLTTIASNSSQFEFTCRRSVLANGQQARIQRAVRRGRPNFGVATMNFIKSFSLYFPVVSVDDALSSSLALPTRHL